MRLSMVALALPLLLLFFLVSVQAAPIGDRGDGFAPTPMSIPTGDSTVSMPAEAAAVFKRSGGVKADAKAIAKIGH